MLMAMRSSFRNIVITVYQILILIVHYRHRDGLSKEKRKTNIFFFWIVITYINLICFKNQFTS